MASNVDGKISVKEGAAATGGLAGLAGLALLAKRRRARRRRVATGPVAMRSQRRRKPIGPNHVHKKSSVPPPKPDPEGDLRRQAFFEKRRFALKRQRVRNNPNRRIHEARAAEGAGPGIQKVSDPKIRAEEQRQRSERNNRMEAILELFEFVDPRSRNRYGQFSPDDGGGVSPEAASAAYGRSLRSRAQRRGSLRSQRRDSLKKRILDRIFVDSPELVE